MFPSRAASYLFILGTVATNVYEGITLIEIAGNQIFYYILFQIITSYKLLEHPFLKEGTLNRNVSILDISVTTLPCDISVEHNLPESSSKTSAFTKIVEIDTAPAEIRHATQPHDK